MRIMVSGSTAVLRRLSSRYPDHLGILLTPRNGNSVGSVARTGLPWAIDNGAFSGFEPERFRKKLAQAAGKPGLLWVVCPDAVADARATLNLWGQWSAEVRSHGVPVAFVLQDGQEDLPLPEADCYFVGGSTEWKLSRAAMDLGAEAKRRGAWLHMGRVNSLRRLAYAWRMGCDSVDGSGYSRFAAVASSKGRTDMMLERHLRYVAALPAQPLLF